MSNLLVNALLKVYQATADERIPGMITEMARCEVERGVYWADGYTVLGSLY